MNIFTYIHIFIFSLKKIVCFYLFIKFIATNKSELLSKNSDFSSDIANVSIEYKNSNRSFHISTVLASVGMYT